MRSKVFRNLDTPFQVFGFSLFELACLCCAFVGGGELAQALGIRRVWVFLITMLVALGLHWFHRSMGQLFGRRLWRFVLLPTNLRRKLFPPHERLS